MTKKQTIELIEVLKKYYPDAKCSLNFSTPFEMLIAVMLSAQCTDERVNKVTPSIFSKYNNPQDFINLDIHTIEKLIHSCGFYKNKAKNIKNLSIMLVNDFDGIVPDTMEELEKLPGIGRKSANVVMLEAFDKPQGIAVDTHVKRISNRLGLSKKSDPIKIEQDLLKLVPKGYLKDVNHLFIWHGRAICKAPTPNCDICPIKTYCKFLKQNKSKKNPKL